MVLMELKMPYRLNDFVFLFILLFPTPKRLRQKNYFIPGGKTSHIKVFLKDRQLMEYLWARSLLGLPQAYKIGGRRTQCQ